MVALLGFLDYARSPQVA